VVGRQPNAPATFTPGEIPSTHFQGLSRPQGTWFCRGYHGKNSQWHHRPQANLFFIARPHNHWGPLQRHC